MSTTALTFYEGFRDPLAAVKQLGESIATSQLFKCTNKAQGEVLAMECLAKRISPLTLARKYNIIGGRLSMESRAMLIDFRRMGGDHEIIARTPERAEIKVTFNGRSYIESLTWEEASKEKWPYGKDGKTIKDNWATPRARRQMLWARVVSEAINNFCPEATDGQYTPEETADISGDERAATAVVTENEPADTVGTEADPGEIADAEYTVTPEIATESAPVEPAVPAGPECCTAGQSKRIKELWDLLGATIGQREQMLEKRRAKVVRNLRYADACELIEKLEARLAAQQQAEAAAVAGESTIPDNVTQAPSHHPASAATVEQCKILLAEMKQLQPDIIDQVKAKLVASRKQKIADLTEPDALALKQALTIKKMDLFFGLSLASAPQAAPAPEEPEEQGKN